MFDSSGKQVPCDGCYDRRIRCKGYPGQPCDPCTKSNHTCTRDKVRRKRGPKKSANLSKLLKASTTGIRNSSTDPSAIREASEATTSVAVSYKGDGDGGFNAMSLDPSNTAEFGAASNRTLNQYGRARVCPEENIDHYVTVNELAGFVMSEASIEEPVPDLDWLLGLRNSMPEDYRASFTTVSNPTTSTLTDFSPASPVSYSRRQNLPNGPQPNVATSSSIRSVVLDGTALALATGMPLNYGTDMVQCVEDYFSRVYHVLPIIHESRFRRMLASPSQLSTIDRGMFLALCSTTTLRATQSSNGLLDKQRSDRGRRYLEQCQKFRSNLECMESTAPSIIASTFLVHVACACLGHTVSARNLLREAICRAMDAGLHKRENHPALDEIDSVCLQRTLALLFVTERATAILDNQDILLFRHTPSLPDVCFDEGDRNTLTGFQCLFGLFTLFDEEIVGLWCSSTPTQDLDPEAARLKLRSLQRKLSTLCFDQHGLNDFQRADVLVTRLWMRLIFWQMAMRLGFLSSFSENLAFSYSFPIHLGKELCTVLQSLPKSALLVHHFSIVSLNAVPQM